MTPVTPAPLFEIDGLVLLLRATEPMRGRVYKTLTDATSDRAVPTTHAPLAVNN